MQLIRACPLCDGIDLRDFYRARDPHYGIPGEHRIVRCAGCSLQFTNPMYSEDELSSLYPNDYYAYHDAPKVSRWKAKIKKLLGYWQGTKEPDFERLGSFLDLGCGSGEVVERMRLRGWDAYGVEISEQAAALGRSRGLQILSGTIQKARFSSESFDYVRASHSFEHVTRPHETLEEIHRVLKPDGTLLLAVPNVDAVSARVFKQYWWHLCAPVHPYGYSAKTLIGMLERHGFQVTRVVFNSDYVGILGSLQIWLNRGNGRKSFEGRVFGNHLLRVISGWLEGLCDLMELGDMVELHACKSPVAVKSGSTQASFETKAVA